MVEFLPDHELILSLALLARTRYNKQQDQFETWYNGKKIITVTGELYRHTQKEGGRKALEEMYYMLWKRWLRL